MPGAALSGAERRRIEIRRGTGNIYLIGWNNRVTRIEIYKRLGIGNCPFFII